MGHDVQALKERIDDIIIKTLITGYPTLSKIQQTVHPDNYANDMCFEILGLDVMLDYQLVPVLLEVLLALLRLTTLPVLLPTPLWISTSRKSSFPTHWCFWVLAINGSTKVRKREKLKAKNEY